MSIMVKLNLELEKQFRQKAMSRYGYSKGSIKQALEVAIKTWLFSEKSQNLPKVSVDDIRGIMSDVKKDSVKLQHEASSLFGKV